MKMLKMFDPKAPIEQQFTRDGRKVLAIFDSGLEVDFPIVAWVDGECCAKGLTRFAEFYEDRSACGADIITRPAQLDMIVYYQNLYLNGDTYNHDALKNAIDEKDSICLVTLEITFNPNSGESSIKTIWKKEAAK